jgi:hypothetical protein
MAKTAVDLSAHINHTVERGSPADFPIQLKPLYFEGAGALTKAEKRLAVVREDTGQLLSVVSDRYRLVPHQEILSAVHTATADLDVGPVPRGVYVDRNGGRMRALYKFPALAQSVTGGDEICPCIKIQNSYDATSRISIHIGAFRFVCTNLAVGGGGIFAGGFMAVHAGHIPLERVSEQLGSFLRRFESIVSGYRVWNETEFDWQRLGAILDSLPLRSSRHIGEAIRGSGVQRVWSAYNVATNYATHRLRSAPKAFELLELINRGFQRQFPVSGDSNTNGRGIPPAVPLSDLMTEIMDVLGRSTRRRQALAHAAGRHLDVVQSPPPPC